MNANQKWYQLWMNLDQIGLEWIRLNMELDGE